jgi:hypothetical protein
VPTKRRPLLFRRVTISEEQGELERFNESDDVDRPLAAAQMRRERTPARTRGKKERGGTIACPLSRVDSLAGSLFVAHYTQVSVTGLVNPSESDAVQWKIRVGNGW